LLIRKNEVSTTDIYTSYQSWCISKGLRPNSNIALGRRLGERGFSNKKSNGVRHWVGVATKYVPIHPDIKM